MPQKEIIKLAWPMAGLVENSPYTQQPENSTLDALNVRPYDQFDHKARGGQRPGLSKYMAGQVSGGDDIQSLLSVVEAVELTEDAGFGDKYANPSSLPTDNIREVHWHPDGDRLLFAGWDGSNKALAVYEFNLLTGFDSKQEPSTSFSSALDSAQFNPAGTIIAVSSMAAGSLVYAYPYNKTTGFGTPFTKNFGQRTDGKVRWHPDGDIVFFVTHPGVGGSRRGILAVEFDAGSGFGNVIDEIEVFTAGLFVYGFSVHPDGDWLVLTGDSSPYCRAIKFDKIAGFSSTFDVITVPGGTTTGYSADFNSSGNFVAVGFNAGISVYPFSKNTGFGTRIAGPNTYSGEGITWSPSDEYIGHVSSSTLHRVNIYPFTGTIDAALTDPATMPTGTAYGIDFHPTGQAVASGHNVSPYLTVWEFTEEIVNPSARKNRLIAVAGGGIYRSNFPPTVMGLSNSGSGTLRSTNPIEGTVAFQNVFFCDGLFTNYVYLDLSDNTAKDWQTAVAAEVAGTELPRGTDDDTLGCRIMALYRGRIVMAGLKEEPHNWFMSASGNPFDWDYSPSPATATQAVAGNNSEVGELGDIITALIPFQDDLLFMGGPNSLWVMRGDPAAGGQIDNISRQIGVVQPRAYTWDSFGTLYFMGLNGFYRFMPDSSAPELLSTNRLDKTLQDINYEENQVMLTYDPTWRGVHVFIPPLSQPSTAAYHYFWDERTNSFWKDQYPITHGPTSIVQYNADDPDNRALILGGYDGYLRYFDPAAKSDDGTAISSRVRFSQINPGGILASSRIGDINLMTDDQSGTVNFELYAAHSPEAAHELADSGSGARLTKVLVGGRNITMRQKIAQNTFIPVLSQNELNESWAYETGGATIELLTRMHYKKV